MKHMQDSTLCLALFFTVLKENKIVPHLSEQHQDFPYWTSHETQKSFLILPPPFSATSDKVQQEGLSILPPKYLSNILSITIALNWVQPTIMSHLYEL